MLQGFVDVSGHGEVTRAVVPVPIEVYTAYELGVPIDADFVVFLQGVNQVFGVFFADVTCEEVVDNEGEPNLTIIVLE